jgi:hypothetical protein
MLPTMTQPDYKLAEQTAYDKSRMVLDLSETPRVVQALLDMEDISDALDQEQEAKLVSYIKALADVSHSKISQRYDSWKAADQAHDVYVDPTSTDFREKAVIGDTRAITDTVITYQMAALAGRNPMFQLEGLNAKSRKPAMLLERVLHQQMRRTGGEARLAQLLLDSARYGFAPTKITWDGQRNQNIIHNANPRLTFPDPRVPWGNWNDMSFVVLSSPASISQLLRTGLYPKLAKYRKLHECPTGAGRFSWFSHTNVWQAGRGLSVDPTENLSGTSTSSFKVGDSHIIDEAWFILSGYELGLPNYGLVWVVATVLDEKYIIRLQLSPYGRQFPMVYGSLYHDVHKTYGQSLYDLLLPLHDMATWLLRSRIDNVRAALSNLIFADPTQVNIPDLIERNPWGIVRTLPGVKPGDGVFIANVPDVTRGHWQDIMALSDLKQRMSAASDAQQGVPTSDVRSATEIARLTQLGSQRLGVASRITSALTIRPMVEMMVSNIQDAITFDASIRVNDQMPSQLVAMAKDGYIDVDIQALQGNIDYLVIDGTLPIEPTRSPETWVNVMQVVHQTGLDMEYNIGQMAEEAVRSMGVSDLDRFRISDEERQAKGLSPQQQISMMERMRGSNPTVMPQEQLARQVERGNLVSQSTLQGRGRAAA